MLRIRKTCFPFFPRKVFFLFFVTQALGCLNISDFTEPDAQENFMGKITIDSSIYGVFSGARASHALSVYINPDGKTATLSGIPTNDPFPLLPDKLYETAKKFLKTSESEDFIVSAIKQTPTVSGFDAEVVDRKTLRITGFSIMNDTAEEFGVEVSGTLVMQGPELATLADDPIIIRIRLGPLRDLFGSYLSYFVRKKGGSSTPLSELDDQDKVNLYLITGKWQIVSVI